MRYLKSAGMALLAGLALAGCGGGDETGPGPDQKLLQAACALTLHTSRPTGTDLISMYRLEVPLTPVEIRRIESSVLMDGRDTYYVRAKFNGQVCFGGDVTVVTVMDGNKVHLHYELADVAPLAMVGKPVYTRVLLDDTFEYTPGQIVNRTSNGRPYSFLLK